MKLDYTELTAKQRVVRWAIDLISLAIMIAMLVLLFMAAANAKPCGKGHIPANHSCHR